MFSSSLSELAAEREGIAADRLAELLGTQPVETRLQVALGQARCAAALGLPDRPKLKSYRWAASCRVHDYINRRAPWSYFVYGPPASKRLPADGAAERIRQAEKRLRRAALLSRLQYLPAREPLTLRMASIVSGVGHRTIEKGIRNGRLVSELRDGRRIVRAGDLRRLLAAKLQGHPIAA